MAKNAIDIVNSALVKIGATPIQGFQDNCAEAIVAKDLYEQVKDTVLSMYPWSFATKRISLAKLYIQNSENGNGGQNTFVLPQDSLRVLSVNARTYAIEGNKLTSPNNQITISYIYKTLEGNFPAFFANVLISRLAAEFCLPLTDSTTRTDFLYVRFDRELKTARLIDASQEVNSNLDMSYLLEGR